MLVWDVYAATSEPNYGHLSVKGATKTYDWLYWLDNHPLKQGDVVEFQLTNEPGFSAVRERHTFAEQEAIRLAVNEAEASGELPAARFSVRQRYREACELQLEVAGHSPFAVGTSPEIGCLIFSGTWSDYKEEVWQARIGTMPSREVDGAARTTLWLPIGGAARVRLGS